MRFLIDECLHLSLVDVARSRSFDAQHIVWLGLSGETDWNLMPRIVADDFTFVTNNARDFRKLYARESLHAGLVILRPQVVPARQRALFAALLDFPGIHAGLVNEVIEIDLDGDTVVMTRYDLPRP